MNGPYTEGKAAYKNGGSSQDNPFDFFTENDKYMEWNDGYNTARNEGEHKEGEDGSSEK